MLTSDNSILSDFSHISDFSFPTAYLLSSFSSVSEAIITNFSLEPTWRWYFTMTPFETTFLGFIILQFAVLNTIGIMPINISQLLNGMPAGRRKRDIPEVFNSKRSLGYQLLKLMKRLDPDECTLKSLCEVELYSCSGEKSIDIPVGIKSVLSNLRSLKYGRQQYNHSSDSSQKIWTVLTKSETGYDDVDDDASILKVYEEAVALGGHDLSQILDHHVFANFPSTGNTTVCGFRYPRCSLGSNEILNYVSQIHILDEF